MGATGFVTRTERTWTSKSEDYLWNNHVPRRAAKKASALNSAQSWLGRLQSASESALALAELVIRVEISREYMRLLLELPIATSQSDEKSRDHISLSRVFPMEMKRRGIEMRMVLEGDCKPSRFDRPLIKESLHRSLCDDCLT
jgi:hypothetical protein